jgi:transcriptional regulator with XRE-family HTH domain
MFSEKIKQLRLAHHMTQKQLGEIANISDSAIREIESGRSQTTLNNVVILADYFNVSVDYLLGRTDKPEVNR